MSVTEQHPEAELFPSDRTLWTATVRLRPDLPRGSAAEQAHVRARLQEQMRLYRMCPRGYAITGRVVANAAIRFFEYETYVFLSGRCR